MNQQEIKNGDLDSRKKRMKSAKLESSLSRKGNGFSLSSLKVARVYLSTRTSMALMMPSVNLAAGSYSSCSPPTSLLFLFLYMYISPVNPLQARVLSGLLIEVK